ncbi:MAG TPA: DUF3299 domain-containing protein [Rhizobacter sp.]
MKHPARATGSLEQQFPHLRGDVPPRTGRWVPVLALLVTGAIVLAAAILVPVGEAKRDFRRHDATPPADAAGDGFQAMQWAELVPAGWNASAQIRPLQEQHRSLADDDPRARASLAKIRDVLDAAPADPALDGRRVRLPGYVVPLGGRQDDTTEFLLVPYFGACLHTPPPPSNQVVHVVLSGASRTLAAMDTVWVRGTLRVERHDSAVAVSGYRLQHASIEPQRPTSSK